MTVISEDAKLELLTHLRKTHGRKDAGESAPRRITLNRKSSSEIKLGSSQGRARTVNVEVRQKRTYIKRDVLEEQAAQATGRARRGSPRRRGGSQRRRARGAGEARRRGARAQGCRGAARPSERRRAEDEKRRAQQADEEARSAPTKKRKRAAASEKEAQQRARRRAARARSCKKERMATEPAKPTRPGTLHVAGRHAGRRRKKKARPAASAARSASIRSTASRRPTAPVVREVAIGETITVAELAQKMAVKGAEVIKVLMKMGVMATINQTIDQDTAVLVVEELGHTATRAQGRPRSRTTLQAVGRPSGDASECRAPPVVTIMGHVDHGKTSLLDYIRRTQGRGGRGRRHHAAHRRVPRARRRTA